MCMRPKRVNNDGYDLELLAIKVFVFEENAARDALEV